MTGTGKQAILPVYMNKHHTLFPGGCSQDKGQASRERIPRGLIRQGRKSTALTSGLSVIVIKSRCDSVTSTLCLCHALKKKKKLVTWLPSDQSGRSDKKKINAFCSQVVSSSQHVLKKQNDIGSC